MDQPCETKRTKIILLGATPRNAYIHFIMDDDQRQRISNGIYRGKVLMKKMGETWRKMNSEDKKPYENLFHLEKQLNKLYVECE